MPTTPSIFKGYDIRGRYPGELDEEAARKIGQAFSKLVGTREPIVIARDMRKSSPDLKTALISGLFSHGATVWDIGEVSIDVFYFALGTFGTPGVMVTASHNPKEWNGMKLYQQNLEGLDPLRLRALVEKSFDEKGGGKLEVREVVPEYVKKVRSFFHADGSRQARTIKVVIDAGNGMVGKIAPAVLDGLPIDVIPLYFEPDGSFPHHVPNPIEEENLRDLQAKVQEVSADLGIAFDADGDRAVFLDEAGTPIRTSVIAALLASVMLRASEAESLPAGRQGEAIVYNVPSSRIVKETIEANGGRAVVSKVGHTYMKQAMQKADALFGAEHSGHYYFKDFFFADSGMAAALVVFDILSHSSHPISHLMAPFKKYKAIAEENFPIKDFSKIKKHLREEFAQGKVSELDGLTVEYPDWWFNVRASETEPVVRLNLEAKDEDVLQEKYAELLDSLRSLEA